MNQIGWQTIGSKIVPSWQAGPAKSIWDRSILMHLHLGQLCRRFDTDSAWFLVLWFWSATVYM